MPQLTWPSGQCCDSPISGTSTFHSTAPAHPLKSSACTDDPWAKHVCSLSQEILGLARFLCLPWPGRCNMNNLHPFHLQTTSSLKWSLCKAWLRSKTPNAWIDPALGKELVQLWRFQRDHNIDSKTIWLAFTWSWGLQKGHGELLQDPIPTELQEDIILMRIAESHLMVSVRTFSAQKVLPRSNFLWILLHFASLHLGVTVFNKSWIQQQIWSMVSKPWVNLSIWFPHSIENIGNILTPTSRATWQTETPDYPKHIVFFAATNVAVLGASGTSMRNAIHIRSSLVWMKQNTHGDRLWQIVHDTWHTICIIAQRFFMADRFSYVLNFTEASTNHLKVTSMMQTS